MQPTTHNHEHKSTSEIVNRLQDDHDLYMVGVNELDSHTRITVVPRDDAATFVYLDLLNIDKVTHYSTGNYEIRGTRYGRRITIRVKGAWAE